MKYSLLRRILGGGRLTASLIYFKNFHRFLNWKNPQDINEKINWMKFYGDTSYWPKLADKYAVREYVKEKGLEHTLVKLYGKWNSPYDIDWDSLPDAFVLKMNNGSGDIEICRDKSKLDKERIIKKFDSLFKTKRSLRYAEPHYDKIKPCIVAEELLDARKQEIESTSLIDYKFWCFDGKVDFVTIYRNRSCDGVEMSAYDVQWTPIPDVLVYKNGWKPISSSVTKPAYLSEMIRIAEILSNGMPEVRVDLYEVNHRVYFGELTFTAAGGFMTRLSKWKLLDMGGKTRISSYE